MKSIQYTSRRMDFKVLAALGAIAFFAIAGVFVTYFVPGPFHRVDYSPTIIAAISVGLAAFVWSIFRLIQPTRPDRNWTIAKFTIVPLYWLLLMLAADVVLAAIRGMPDIGYGTLL